MTVPCSLNTFPSVRLSIAGSFVNLSTFSLFLYRPRPVLHARDSLVHERVLILRNAGYTEMIPDKVLAKSVDNS